MQECVDVVHCGHAVAAPKPFEFAIADSCDDGVVASQFDVAIVLFDYLCLIIEGLSVVCGDEFVSLHGALPFLCACVGWCVGCVRIGIYWYRPLAVCIIAQKRLAVK